MFSVNAMFMPSFVPGLPKGYDMQMNICFYNVCVMQVLQTYDNSCIKFKIDDFDMNFNRHCLDHCSINIYQGDKSEINLKNVIKLQVCNHFLTKQSETSSEWERIQIS